MKRLWMGGGALGMLAVFFYFYPFHSVLQITNVKTGRVLFCAKVAEGEEFILSFVHSVNKRPVYDTIRVEGTHFLIVKSRFDSFGAGMPDVSTEGMKLAVGKDGWLEWIVNRPVPEVSFFVGWVAKHSLRLKEKDMALADLAEPGTLLALRIEKASHYQMGKGRCMQ